MRSWAPALTTAPKIAKNEKGQSTVEFVLTMMLLMAFILFFFQLGLVFAFGNYAHYITFMSARAYMAAGASSGDQLERARAVVTGTLKGGAGQGAADRFPSIAKGYGGSDLPGLDLGPGAEFSPGDRDSSWEQGVRYTFRSKLFLLQLNGGSASSSGLNSLTLTSESWLGREPADSDCQVQMGGIYDNGC